MKVYIILRSTILEEETWIHGVYRNKEAAEYEYNNLKTSDNVWIEEHELK